MIETACALYRIFKEHPKLKRHEITVWTCNSIAKLAGEMAFRVDLFERTGSYELPKQDTEEESPEEKKKREREERRQWVLDSLEVLHTTAESLPESWNTLLKKDRKVVAEKGAAFARACPPELAAIIRDNLPEISD